MKLFAIRSLSFCSPATIWWKAPEPWRRRPATLWPWITPATTGTMPTPRATCWSDSTHLRATHPRLCLISGGEVTVTMDRIPGAGGRNQQFALACALELAHHPGERLTVLSAGSDGIDGNTQIAGAIADPTTVARARAFGFHPEGVAGSIQCLPAVHRFGRRGCDRTHRPEFARSAPADRRQLVAVRRA